MGSRLSPLPVDRMFPMRLPLLLVACLSPAAAQQDAEFFETKIRPLLAANCYSCHTQTAMGGLRLDSKEAAMAGGKSGPVIIPGNPAGSVLIQAVRRTHASLKMPPTAPLKASDVALLEEWVKGGAVFPESKTPVNNAAKAFTITPEHRKFWSFQPLSAPKPPQAKDAAWVKTGVDAFILAKLRENKLEPNPSANRTALLRRVTFDLIGLPPTPEEVQAAALQFVRKVSGYRVPAKKNEEAFAAAVEAVTFATANLLAEMDHPAQQR